MDLPRPPSGDKGYVFLVDADGANPDVVPIMLERLTLLSSVPVRRLYGNLSTTGVGKSWETLARLNGFERRHRPKTTSTKNGADIALAVDAMDLVHERYRYFCLVAGDTDFGPLIERIHRAHGNTVIVSANPALHAWSKYAFKFDQLLPKQKPSKVPAAKSNVAKPKAEAPRPLSPPVLSAKAPNPKVQELLTKALEHAQSQNDGNDWVDASRLGSVFQSVDPGYSRSKYGLSSRTTVRQMAEAFPSAFEVKTQTSDGKNRVLVRLRPKTR